MKPVLHVGAMAFPAHRGTQAAVHMMAETHARAGYDAHLVTYARGEFELESSYVLHRAANWPHLHSFDSGPSLAKVALDLQLLRYLRRLKLLLEPSVFVAHHVEAAVASFLAGCKPLVFFAHTSLREELPTYASSRLGSMMTIFGTRADVWLCRLADAIAAVSPMLRDALERDVNQTASPSTDSQPLREIRVQYVPIPWDVPAPIAPAERARAREKLAFAETDNVVLYAGNLDPYQDVKGLLEAFARVAARRPAARLLVATNSAPDAWLAQAHGTGLRDRVHLSPLEGEAQRRELYAAADLAVVPRRAAGGLPVKLLDALARGIPTVACTRAAAGLPLEQCAMLVEDDAPEALAHGMDVVLSADRTSVKMTERARVYVAAAHSSEAFISAFRHVLQSARFRSVAARRMDLASRARELFASNSSGVHQAYSSCSSEQRTSPST